MWTKQAKMAKSPYHSTIFLLIVNAVICQGFFLPSTIPKTLKNLPKIIYGNWKPIRGKPVPASHYITSKPAPYIPTSKPIRFENDKLHEQSLEDDIGFLLNPGPPSDHSFPPFTTPTYPIVTTEASKNQNSVLNEIPEDFSQNPEHISMISQYPISYKDTDKLIGKPKLVGGSLTNYHPRPKII